MYCWSWRQQLPAGSRHAGVWDASTGSPNSASHQSICKPLHNFTAAIGVLQVVQLNPSLESGVMNQVGGDDVYHSCAWTPHQTTTMWMYRLQVYRLQEALHASEERCRYLERELQACRASKGEGVARGRDAWSSIAKQQHLQSQSLAVRPGNHDTTTASAQLDRLVSLARFLLDFVGTRSTWVVTYACAMWLHM